MAKDANNTRTVDEFDSSLIARVTNIGIQIAIVKASIVCKTAQVGELNIAIKTLGSKPVIAIYTVGNPIKIIRVSIRFMSKNGASEQYIILYFFAAC